MDRRAARTIALAVLAVLALGVAAATIDSAVTGGSGGFGAGESGASGVGPSDEDDVGLDDSRGGGGAPIGPICLPILRNPAVMAGLLVAFAGLLALVYYDTRSLLPVAAVGVTFGLPGYVFWVFLTVCGPVSFGGASLGASNGSLLPRGGGGLGGSGEGAVSPPTALFGLLLAFALVGAVALLFLSTGDDDAVEDRETVEEETDVDVGDIGRAAGAAADRIEDDADVGNEVYRAWAEMTGLLDISNPRTSTPGEFASAAVDAGMAREDVDELTRLFEEVRYGGESATADREERAVTALRRIESTYADAGAERAGEGGP